MNALPPGMDLSKIPLAINPDGSPPNFDNPPSLAPATYGICSTLIVLTAAVVVLRILPVFKKGKLKLDDYLCLVAFVLSCAYGALIMTMASTATHAWDTPISAFSASWLQRNAAQCLIYGPAMFFAKAAILTLYLRLFDSVPWMRYTCWVAIVFLGLAYFSTIPVYAVFAVPYGSEQWDVTLAIKMGKTEVMAIIQASITVASDVFLLILPISSIVGLNLSLKKRIGVVGVFLTGIAAISSAVLGLYFRIQNKRAGSAPDQDKSWVAAQTYLTALVELFITIVVSCAPGCVASWRNVIKESYVIASLRTFMYSSHASIWRVSSSDPSSKEVKHSPASSEINFAKYGFPSWDPDSDEKPSENRFVRQARFNKAMSNTGFS